MPRIHQAAMADLKKQEEEQMAYRNSLQGRANTERRELSNFRSGKWRRILDDKQKATDDQPTFRFSTRVKFEEVMLEHEKDTRVTRKKMRRLLDAVAAYVPQSDQEGESVGDSEGEVRFEMLPMPETAEPEMQPALVVQSNAVSLRFPSQLDQLEKNKLMSPMDPAASPGQLRSPRSMQMQGLDQARGGYYGNTGALLPPSGAHAVNQNTFYP